MSNIRGGRRLGKWVIGADATNALVRTQLVGYAPTDSGRLMRTSPNALAGRRGEPGGFVCVAYRGRRYRSASRWPSRIYGSAAPSCGRLGGVVEWLRQRPAKPCHRFDSGQCSQHECGWSPASSGLHPFFDRFRALVRALLVSYSTSRWNLPLLSWVFGNTDRFKRHLIWHSQAEEIVLRRSGRTLGRVAL